MGEEGDFPENSKNPKREVITGGLRGNGQRTKQS